MLKGTCSYIIKFIDLKLFLMNKNILVNLYIDIITLHFKFTNPLKLESVMCLHLRVILIV